MFIPAARPASLRLRPMRCSRHSRGALFAQQALHMMRRLIGQGRYQQDVFTSYRAELAAPVLFDASEVALHNDDEHGYWMTIDGAVYDVTEFAHRHPGGRAIIVEHAGRDATKSYRTVEHHLDPEIEAMLGMYKIGMIRRLEFGSRWCIAVGPKGLVFVRCMMFSARGCACFTWSSK
jgi:hypothetical protein